MRGTFTVLTAVTASVVGISAARAASVSLTAGQSQAAISYGSTLTSGGTSATPLSGLYFLYRDGGGDKLQDAVQQTLFYRVGGSGAATEINTGTTANLVYAATNVARIDYAHSAFTLQVTYTLTGAGSSSWASALNRNVRVVNTSGSDLNLSLFSYSDYTLTGFANLQNPSQMPVPGDAYFDNNFEPSISQAPNGFEFAEVKTVNSEVRQWDTWGNASGAKITELQNRFLTAPKTIEVSTAGSLLSKLLGGSPDLTQTAGVVGGQDGNGFAENVAFAAQWDLMLGAGGSKTISEHTAIIPEPASLGLLALGAGLLAFPRRRNAR